MCSEYTLNVSFRANAKAKMTTVLATSENRQMDLFSPERLAKRPYCMAGKSQGMLIRDVERALGYPYVQANSPWLIYRLVLDVDRDLSLTAAQGTWHDDYVMPDPSWYALNPENGHAHIGYEIAVPVARHDSARQKPLKLLAAIEHALTRQISADSGYVGLVCKNPLHQGWDARVVRAHPYDLPELASWVDLKPYSGKRPTRVADCSIGRNCAMFDKLRSWAYATVREFKGAAGREAWNAAVLTHAEALNDYTPPLPHSEVRATARSVAKYVWSKFDIAASDARFSQLQAHRGQRGGFASGAARFNATVDLRLEAIELRQVGMTQGEIAARLSVTIRTVRRWLSI
jgi:hypothetical protein